MKGSANVLVNAAEDCRFIDINGMTSTFVSVIVGSSAAVAP